MALTRLKAIFDFSGDALAQKKRRRRLALVTGIGLLGWSIFGGDQGLVSLALSWRETWALKREISELQQANRDLAARQQRLQHDRAFYEKTAREKLLLKNPGDLIYRFDRN